MNKKFISALLFGAMLFAPASMFVSCSYDDDIAELRNDLNATKTDLSSLVDEKMKNVDAEIAALGAQAEALEAAYEAADEALQEAIANATNDAKGYADVQAAQAQAAAIAAAQEMVNGAKAALEASLAEVNTIVGEQGKTIAALLEADQTLTTAIAAAQARANEAYALAEQASKLATENAESVQKLTEALAALQATVKTLEDQAQTCVLGDKVEDLIKQTADNAAAIEAQAAKLKALEESNAAALESAVNAAKAELEKLISANTAEINDLKDAVEAAKAEATKAVDAAKKLAADELAAAKTELEGKISAALEEVEKAYKAADQALEDKINTLLSDLEELEGEVEDINAEIKKINADLVYAGKKLKSMVFCPELYYQGIEAVGVYSYNYKALTLAAANVTADQSGDKATETTEQISVVPDVTFNYFLNPSNAQISNKVENFNFILNNAKYTRAITKDQISIVKVSDNDGKLSVVAKMHNANAISKISNDPQVTESNVDVVALQYTDKNQNDTIITSDFAALKHYVVDEFYINKVKTFGKVDEVLTTSGENHLWATAADAIAADPMFEIAYMNDAIELDQWINVHYRYNGSADQVWGGQKTVNGKNFKLVYELIGYKSGSNTTSESEHATISDNVLTTKGYNNEITPAIVGRTPLLRVKLVDENSNKIAAVGYAKILITHIKVDDMFVGPYEVKKPFVVACNPSNVELGKMMSWDKIENDVLAKIGLSRQQFDDLYKLDANNGVAYQFVTNANGVYVTTPTNWGSVMETANNDAAHETDVLTWTVDNNTAYQFFKNENNKTKSVIVRFVPTNAADDGIRPVIYVTLSWTPSSRLVAPFASISDESKVYGTWYAKDANSLGKSDLHAHVMEAKNGATDDFDFSVEKSTFMDENGQIIEPSALIKKSLAANGYTTLANSSAFKVEYHFVTPEYANAGSAEFKTPKYYKLRVVNDNNGKPTILQAAKTDSNNWTEIATLDCASGKIEYLNNAVSCDILNYVAHNKLAQGESLTAKVQMVATTCDPASAIALSNHEMNVKFLRPLNVDGTKLMVVDADPSTHKITLAKGNMDADGNKQELNFTDWRDFDNAQVWLSSNNYKNLFQFYGVRSIVQDPVKKVTSNFAQGGDKFTELNSSEFVFTYACTGQPSSSNMGTVTYKKVTTVAVHEFIAKIPVIVTYDWGKLYAEIEVVVKPTINNARVNK